MSPSALSVAGTGITLCAVLLVACAGGEPEPATAAVSTETIATAVGDQRTAAARDLADVQAVLVQHGGRTVFEEYYGASAEDFQGIESVTKSVVSALVGIAIADGLIPGLDSTLGQLLPDRRDDMSPEVAGTTLEQLLTMSGGFAGDFNDPDGDEWVGAADPVGTILTTPVRSPGDRFAYSNGTAHLVAAVLEHATGETPLAYARRVLLDPLGVDTQPAQEIVGAPENLDAYLDGDLTWVTDSAGLDLGSGGLKLRPRDLAAFGSLYLDGGVRDGDQVVPAAWVDESTTSQVGSTGKGIDNGYGYYWWTGTVDDDPAYLAYGYGGQAIRVIPDRDLVIVVSTALPELESEGAPYFAVLFLTDEIIAPLFDD